MSQQIERRFLRGGQLRARKDGKPGIEGVVAVYNQIYDNGWFKETIKPGAFDDVLAADPDVRCLFNHEPDNVLGRTKQRRNWMSQQIERRFLRGGQLRARKDGKPGIEGVGAVYNQIYDNGWFKETIKPGAFDDVLAADPDVRCLFNHEPDNVLGRTKSKTLRIVDSPDGLRFDCDTDPNTRIGVDVRAMIDRGDVDGCSIGFVVGQACWRDEFDDKGAFVSSTREIEKFAALFDVGPVTFPAYTETSVEARSAFWPGGVPAEIRSHVPELRADDDPAKKVDGESLTRKCFLLAGDPDKTDTWELPWKFSTDAKTKSHLRDALSRFDQVKGFSEEALDKAWSKLLMLCDHYDIDVADKARPKGERSADPGCDCECDACQDGNCEGCDCGDDCDADNCANDECNCESSRSRLRLRARAAEVTL